MHSALKHLLFAGFALTLASVSLARDFEGKLEMTMTSGKKTTPMTYYVKSGKIRFEMKPDAKTTAAGLVDGATGDITILMPEQKMFMTISGKAVAAMAPADFALQETGRTETIAGKKCTEFIAQDKKHTFEIWATDEIKGISNVGEAFSRRGQRSAWEEEMIRRNLFALRVVTKNKKGIEQTRMECTAITAQKLDDALFRIPDGYSKMPGLGDLLGR